MSSGYAKRASTWKPTGHCNLLAVDIASFGARERTDHVKGYIRNALYDMIEKSLTECRISAEDYFTSDCGDGAIVIIPKHVHVSALASTLIDWLRAALHRHNQVSSEIGRMRLRVALHSGEVHTDKHGVVGSSIVHLCRLLDAQAVRHALTDSGAALALIVSDALFNDVLCHAPGPVVPTDYRPVQIDMKE